MRVGVKGIMRGLVVGVLICSWLAISNHCAFAAVTSKKTEPAQNECPFHHSKPAKPKSQSVQCCKILRAVVATMAKTWTRDDARFSDIDLSIERLIQCSIGHKVTPLLLDTGPPGAHSFAELILQQSVLAHAPPFSI
jgi:hypothetical protein